MKLKFRFRVQIKPTILNIEFTYILLVLTPIALGGCIAIVNSDAVNSIAENGELKIRQLQESVSQRSGWLYRFVINPTLLIPVKFSDFTDSFSHRGLKNGTRVTASIYFGAAWFYLLTIAAAFMIGLAICVIGMYYIFQYLNSK